MKLHGALIAGVPCCASSSSTFVRNSCVLVIVWAKLNGALWPVTLPLGDCGGAKLPVAEGVAVGGYTGASPPFTVGSAGPH